MADKQGNKYSKWLLTIQKVRGIRTLPSSNEVTEMFNFVGATKFVFQLETGERNKQHWQCCFLTKKRVRQTALLKQMSNFLNRKQSQFTLQKQDGSWADNVKYCTKAESRVEENFYSNFRINVYSAKDIQCMDKPNRRPFQQSIVDLIMDPTETYFLEPDDRTIYWLYDPPGSSGKSKVSKWFLHHYEAETAEFTINTDNQLRSAAIGAGPKDVIFVDLGRSVKSQAAYVDKVANIMSVVEDLKNGKLVSAFYGQYSVLLMDPPHVFVFSNEPCPIQLLSRDRWSLHTIDPEDFTLESYVSTALITRSVINDLESSLGL